MLCDLHTHTVYSHGIGYAHGKGTIRENVESAARQGIRQIAITDHGPGHRVYGLKMEKLPQMRDDIAEAQALFPEVEIKLGVEANIVDTPNGLDVPKERFGEFDFVIAGYHYGLPKGYMAKNYLYWHAGLPSGSTEQLRNKNTEMVVRALHENEVKVITHPCDKGPFDLPTICKACEETNTLMEINTRHKHLSAEDIAVAAAYDVQFIISSDAHKPEQVGTFAEGVMRAEQAGLPLSRIVNIAEREKQ